MNKRSSKAMMILLLVFLLLATCFLIWSLEYQITSPENRFIENLPAHDSHEDIELTYIYSPISKAYQVVRVGVVTVSIGFIVFAIFCIRRKLYGRVEVVTFILTLIYWVAAVLVRNM
jgi:hypothetical protein